MHRRQFLQKTISALSLAAWPVLTAIPATATQDASAHNRIRLGGSIFIKSDDPEQLAQEHRKLGYRAAFCPSVKLSDSERIKAIRAAFARQDVVLAEVGRWVNLMDADPNKRKENFANVIDGLALAEAIGALCCVDIAGSFNPTVWFGPHPKNLSTEFFDLAVENARTIIDAVKPKHAKFCYEMMGWALPDSAEAYVKLIKAIDRPAFGVHLDPCNAINCPDRFYRNTELINECFDKLGPAIVSCHAKDLAWNIEMNVHFKEVQPGTGSLDYATYLKRLAQLPHHPPLMLEHLASSAEYDAARAYLFSKGAESGLSFK